MVRFRVWGFFSGVGGGFPRTAGGVLKNFANFTWKHLCWSLFFTKLQAFRPATLLKRDTYTGVFLWNLRNSEEQLFRKTSERLLLCLITLSWCPEKYPREKSPPEKCPWENCPPENYPPEICLQENCLPEKCPRKNAPQENCPRENCPPGKLFH